MAKYKITGIPQEQTAWPPKFLRRKKNKETQPVVTSNWNSPVEGFFPTDPLLGSTPVDPSLIQPVQITNEQLVNTLPTDQKTEEEIINTLPTVFPYGYKTDLYTGNMVTAPIGTPAFYKGISGNTVTSVESNPYAPVDINGNPLVCQPGTSPYMGQCLTPEAIAKLEAEREAVGLQIEEEEKLRLAEEQKKREEEEERLWQEKLAQREADFKKKNKFDKLDPLETIPLTEYESRLSTDPEYENQLKAQGYFINKNETTGNVELFPSNEIYTRIWDSGLRTDDIINKLGVGTKETIENYFGDFMGQADEYHEYQTKKAVLDLMEKKGYSLDNAVSYLANVKKLGTKEDLYKSYGKDFKEIENYAKAYIAYSDDYEKPYEKDQTTDLIDRWTDNDIITLARDREFIDSHGANIDIVSPNATGRQEWGAQILQALRSGKWGWKPKSNELVKLAADDTYKNLVVEPTDLDKALINNLKDYQNLEPQAYKKKYFPTIEQDEEDWKKGKVAVQISETDEWRPNKMYVGGDEDGWGGQYYQYQFEVPAGKDPITGEQLTKFVTPDEMAGQTVYMTQEEADKYEKAMLADNMQDFQSSFLYNLPGTIAMGGLGLIGASRALAYAPIKSLPWLTGGNALNAYFAYEALKPQGHIQQAYEGFSEGDHAKGFENLLWGGLGVLPLIKPAANTFKAINELRKPGSLGVLPTSGNYSFLYNSPLQSGLVVGNPNIGNATEAFTNLTNPLNRFTKYANLGEFKIMRSNIGSLTNNSRYIGANINTLLNEGKTAAQVYENIPKTLDTEVSLYRSEIPGYLPSESKTANEYNNWDYGPVAEMSESEIAEAMQDPAAIRYVDENGVERIGSFFPQNTAGKWWSTQKVGERGAPHAVNTYVFDPVTGQYIDKANEMVYLETKVPFSKLEEYNVKNDPAALSFAGQPEKEFILPDEYKEVAKSYDPLNQNTITQNTDDIVFYHGGLDKNATVADIDPLRLAQRQNKKGRSYAGFYMSPDLEEGSWALKYARENPNAGLHEIRLPSNAKGYKYEGSMERIKQSVLKDLQKQGYDYIEGTNLFGQPEYVLLNTEKATIKEVSGTVEGLNTTRQPLNIDQALAEEQALTTADDQLGIAGVSGVTPEIESIYNSYPELSKIGTADEYAEYLRQTFPNSSAQDILYHVNRGDEVLAESGRPFYATQDKGWLYELEEMKGTRKPVLLNLENPTVLDQSYEFTDKAKEFRGSGLGSNLITPTEARLEGADGVIGRDMFQGEGGNTYVAFEPEQVLPLGTAKDAEMFKEWKASQSTGVSQESISTQAKQIVNKSDNEIAANVIDDMRNNKIELWQTEEGKRRLQLMIDNTPSLAGQTPETLIEGMSTMNNLNKVYGNQLNKRKSLEDQIDYFTIFYDEGKMSTQDYKNLVDPLEAELNSVNTAISETEKIFGDKAGFYGMKDNQLFVSGDKFAAGDLKKVTAHELGHYLGSFANKEANITYLDEQLKELQLVSGKSAGKQLEIPGMEVVSEESKAHSLFGTANPNYLEKTLEYFNTGSKGTEKVPFVAEIRQDMLDKGILKNEYDPITIDMLREHYKTYKNLKGEKYPLRLYDIMENNPKNFSILKNVINALPIIAGGVATTLSLANEEQTDGNVTQAGAPIMILAAFLSRNPKIKIPNQLRTLMSDYGKKGLKALNTVNKVNYFNNQIKALAKEHDELVKELGSVWPDDWAVDPSKKGLLAREEELGKLLNTKKRKFENYFEDKNRLIPKSRKMYERQQDINKYSKIKQDFVKTGEGLEQTQPSIYKGAVTTGEQVVTDFSTGEKIKAQVELPKVDVKYSIQDGELVVKDASTNEPVISQEYVNSLSNSKQKVETDIPGAKVFGSSVLVTEAGMPHITGDIDVLISESAYNKNVKDKFSFVQDYGPAKQHSVYPQYGQEGTLDFNIVHENPNGTVKPVWRKDVNTQEETSLEVELFRQFYPEQFQKASIESIKTGKPIEINMSTEEFMNGIDSKVKTVIDSYEATPLTKWGSYKSSKEKHIVRPDVLIEYGDPAVVAKGQEAYIKSIAGHKATLGHQFKVEDLSDPAKNMDALIAMGFKGDDVVRVANDPARMQLALNDYYINMTTFTREISPHNLPLTTDKVKTIENALTEWYPAAGGGSLNGMGLNTVRKGNPIHVYDTENAIIGHRQIGIKTDISNPEAYVKSINRATSGTYVYTPEEAKQVQEIFLKYLPQYKYQLDNIKESRDILNLIIADSDYTQGKLALDEMAETMGIRAIAKDADIATPTYGASRSQYASLFGNFDELVDSMLYSYKKYHTAPKSGFQRKEKLESLIANKASTSSQISTIDDFNKINSIIDNGIINANTRLSLIRNEYNALIAQQEALINKFTKGAQTEYNAVEKRIQELQTRASEIYNERQILEVKKNKFKSKLQNVGLAVGATGALVGVYYIGQIPTQTEQDLIDRGIDYELFTDDKDLYPTARRYIYNNPKAQVWPSGERIIIKNGRVMPPVSLTVINDEIVFDPNYQMNQGTTNKKQFGGDSNFLEMELTDKEIEDYIRKGYTVIEE